MNGKMMGKGMMDEDPDMKMYRDVEGEEQEGIMVPKSDLPDGIEVGATVTMEVVEDMGDHVRLAVSEEASGEEEEMDDDEDEELYS